MESGGADFADYLDRQSAYTQTVLAANPGRPRALQALRDADAEAATAVTTSSAIRVGTRLFYLQSLPGSTVPSLLARSDGHPAPKVVVNAASLPKDQVIGWFEASPRGTKIAYGATASSESVVLGRDTVIALPQHDVSLHTSVFVAPFADSSRANAPWRRIFGEDDEVVQVAVAGRYLYALSDRGDARRTIVVRDRLSGADVRTISPDGVGFRTAIFANRTGLYVAKRVGAEVRLDRYDLEGRFVSAVGIPKATPSPRCKAILRKTRLRSKRRASTIPGIGTKLADRPSR